MNKKHEFVEDLIREIEFRDVPEEFIKAARVINYAGEVTIMDPDEISQLIRDPESLEENDVASVEVILDLEAIDDTLEYYAEIILSSIPE